MPAAPTASSGDASVIPESSDAMPPGSGPGSSDATEAAGAPGPNGTPPGHVTAKKAGRGGAAVALAKVYFILVGLVQQIALKRVLGLDAYGALSSALQAASIAYNPVVQTSIQGVSRVVASSADEERPRALRRALSAHALVALVGGALFFVAAAPLGRWMGAPHIVLALQLLSAVMVAYGLYAPLVGALNGLHRFLAQAGLDALAATLRTIGLIGGAYWFAHRAAAVVDGASGSASGLAGRLGGVEGAILGFVASATLILIVSVVLVGIGKGGGTRPSFRQHFAFLLPLLLGQALLNCLFQADALLLRRFASEAAASAGMDVTAADSLVGAYRAAQLFCFLPYQLLMSITFVLFPMVAQAAAAADREAVRRYVRNGIRLAAMVTGLLVSVVSGLSYGLIDLVFGADAAQLGGGAAQILAVGLGFLAIFGIQTAVLNSLGYERASAWVTGLAFVLVVAACFIGVRGESFGEVLLLRTAWATAAGLTIATCAAGWAVRRTAGGVIAPLSALRIAGALAITAVVGRLLPEGGKLMTIVYAPVLASLYVTCLVLSRELGGADLAQLKAVIRR